MTALPKRRISRSRQGNRRSHHRLSAPPLMACPNCRQRKLQHHVCPHCGYYHGRQVVQVGPAAPQG